MRHSRESMIRTTHAMWHRLSAMVYFHDPDGTEWDGSDKIYYTSPLSSVTVLYYTIYRRGQQAVYTKHDKGIWRWALTFRWFLSRRACLPPWPTPSATCFCTQRDGMGWMRGSKMKWYTCTEWTLNKPNIQHQIPYRALGTVSILK